MKSGQDGSRTKKHSHETCPLPAALVLSKTSFHLVEVASPSHMPAKPTFLAFAFAGLDATSDSGDCRWNGELIISRAGLDVSDVTSRVRGETDFILFD